MTTTSKRRFLKTTLALAMAPAMAALPSGPAHAVLAFLRLFSVVRVASATTRMVRITRMVSRGSRVPSRGLRSVRSTPRPAMRPPARREMPAARQALNKTYSRQKARRELRDTVDRELRGRDSAIAGKDRKKVGDNLLSVIDGIKTAAGLTAFVEFLDHWETSGMSSEQARGHLDTCGPCREVYVALAEDTTLAYAPILDDGSADETPSREEPKPFKPFVQM